jgi:hypothetical protein
MTIPRVVNEELIFFASSNRIPLRHRTKKRKGRKREEIKAQAENPTQPDSER